LFLLLLLGQVVVSRKAGDANELVPLSSVRDAELGFSPVELWRRRLVSDGRIEAFEEVAGVVEL